MFTIQANGVAVDTSDNRDEALRMADVWTKRTHNLHVVTSDKVYDRHVAAIQYN